MRAFWIGVTAVSLWGIACAEDSAVTFEKIVLTGEYYCDGVTAADIDHDGQMDVIAGPFWYAGPSFQQSREIYPPVPIPRAPSPSNSMFSFARDFDGDGDLDVLVLGRVHKHAAYWYENPHPASGPWKKHYVFERIRGESPTLVDIDGDHAAEIVCHWEGRWGLVRHRAGAPTSPWEFTPIGERHDWPQFYHGTGVGDVNQDGRLDVLINDGWYEQPSTDESEDRLWTFHSVQFSPFRGGAQMFADDIDADGDADVITSLHAHQWGLAWLEQSSGGDQFTMHKIMGSREEESKYGVAFSQPHALEYADINADGRKDIVVGKRRWAHGPEGDVEPAAAPVVYWFENVLDASGAPKFRPHLIDGASGVGTQICVADLNGDGRLDVMTASKLGVFVFINRMK